MSTPPPPVTLATVRQNLATAIQQTGYKAHAAPLATVIPPAVVIVPDQPYLEARTLASGGIVWTVRYELIVAVATLDNRASLDQLEQIIVKVCASLGPGVAFSEVSAPALEEVGPSSLLTARIPVTVRANLTAPALT
jgi:hypothetical protein